MLLRCLRKPCFLYADEVLRGFQNVEARKETEFGGVNILLEQMKGVKELKIHANNEGIFLLCLCVSVCWRMTQLVAIFHYEGLFNFVWEASVDSLLFSLSLWLVSLLWTVEIGWEGWGLFCRCCGESLHAVEDSLPDRLALTDC